MPLTGSSSLLEAQLNALIKTAPPEQLAHILADTILNHIVANALLTAIPVLTSPSGPVTGLITITLT